MHVLVLGAGVVGITTAYALAEAGARVTVIDRRSGPAQETSAANGGHLSASQARPWATPAVPRQLVKWLGRADAPLRLPLARWDPELWRWGTHYLRNCTPGRYRANAQSLLRLAQLSRDALDRVVASSGVEFDHRAGGLLQLNRSAKSLDRAQRDAERLLVEADLLTADDCARIEPALSSACARGLIAGGLLYRDAATGDAAKFTTALAAAAAHRQVAFRYDTDVERIEVARGTVTGLRTSTGWEAADAVVVALGMGSRALLAPLGIDLPLYPVKGYSITLPASPTEPRLPRIGIIDDDRKVVFARFGTTLRGAGTAEFAGFDTRIDDRRVRPIVAAAQELFPGPFDGATAADANAWTGLRPMTPDGPPILGAAPGVAGLFLNTGHGPLGWTLAAGSAQLLADLVHGRTPPIDPAPYSVTRFRAQ